MSDIQIFEPAMCCSTGLCGPSIDPELLRVSTIFDALQKEGVSIERFNLSGAPEAFVQNAAVTKHLQVHGMESLPLTLVDGAVAVSGRYPTTEEFAAWSGIDAEKLPKAAAADKESAPAKSAGSCCCGSSGCC